MHSDHSLWCGLDPHKACVPWWGTVHCQSVSWIFPPHVNCISLDQTCVRIHCIPWFSKNRSELLDFECNKIMFALILHIIQKWRLMFISCDCHSSHKYFVKGTTLKDKNWLSFTLILVYFETILLVKPLYRYVQHLSALPFWDKIWHQLTWNNILFLCKLSNKSSFTYADLLHRFDKVPTLKPFIFVLLFKRRNF